MPLIAPRGRRTDSRMHEPPKRKRTCGAFGRILKPSKSLSRRRFYHAAPQSAEARNAAPQTKNPKNRAILGVGYCWWPGAESNHRHADFQNVPLTPAPRLARHRGRPRSEKQPEVLHNLAHSGHSPVHPRHTRHPPASPRATLNGMPDRSRAPCGRVDRAHVALEHCLRSFTDAHQTLINRSLVQLASCIFKAEQGRSGQIWRVQAAIWLHRAPGKRCCAPHLPHGSARVSLQSHE
ncbi:Uncharacterised protein [Burkholderia pseudomallei]|nr:Uncharacterised protein [Burkholderia pseudomallei]CAJ2837414.1 Uncharacterised protein [Burkholderia pseudomallei]VBO65790.1 Uncharacterised protein [Burkholderia pseudomallei]VBY43511.1 Uncharacterised protein [Burkholderia pseudomallei]VBZ55649.1 Uncharacterised protein [Burkholderia pseudomallei]